MIIKSILKYLNFLCEYYFKFKIVKVHRNNWRLPTIEEFIANIGTYKDEFTYFSNLKEEQYWTKSTTDNKETGWAITLDKKFIHGYYLIEIDKQYENMIVFVKEDINGHLEWTKSLGIMDYKAALKLLHKFNSN